MKAASYLNTANKSLLLYVKIYYFIIDMHLKLDYGDLHTSVRYPLSDTPFEYISTKKTRRALCRNLFPGPLSVPSIQKKGFM